MDCCEHQWIHACAWGDLDPQTTGGAVAPCPLSRGVTVAAVLCPEPAGASEASRALLSYHSDSRKNQAPGSPTSVLDPKVPRTTQGSRSPLCWSLRPRLTLTVRAGTTGLLTETQAGGNWDETSVCQGLVLRELSNFK